MLYAYQTHGSGLAPLPEDQPLAEAVWIDLYRPRDTQIHAVEALGVELPTLQEMEEIELSSRIYRDGDTAFMTVVLPGQLPEGKRASMPVAFILSRNRLITLRHHAPRPFQIYPTRAEVGLVPPDSADGVFLALIDDVVARLADHSEASGHQLEEVASRVFTGTAQLRTPELQQSLQQTGREAELMSQIRHSLLTLERVVAFYTMEIDDHRRGNLRPHAKAIARDIRALEVHSDFLSSRAGRLVEATIGMINLQQNNTVRILSVVAALYLPPTLIASIYGMNFDDMPELHWSWGYPWALGMMALSAAATWLLARAMKWL